MVNLHGPKYLLDSEDHWVTSMGAWLPGVGVVFRGRDLMHDLKHLRWMGLLVYGITGRRFDDNQVRLFEGLWRLCASYPDPRLWNNRVAALAGTARSTGALAVSAANAVSEASIYGRQPDIMAIDFLLRVQERLDSGAELAALIRKELKEYRRIPGYGRPITARDERIEPVMSFAEELNFASGTYVRLAFAIEDLLRKGRWRLRMNIAAVAAALCADQGLSPREYYLLSVLCFSAGMFPAYIGAMQKPEGAFFPLRCSRIQYDGKPRRKW